MNVQEAMECLPEYLDGLMKRSTPSRPAWNMELLRGGGENIWNYVDACMVSAMLSMYRITKEEAYLEFCDSFMDWFVREDGTIRTYQKEDRNIDNICPGKNLFALYRYTGKEKYKKAMQLLREQLDGMPRTKGGNFWHKEIYPWQVWLDGLYMAQPFYMEYERTFRDGKGCKDIYEQFGNVYRLMRKDNGLYYHGYDESRGMYWADPESGCSPNCWVRAVGWLMAALADTLEAADQERDPESYGFLARMMEELACALVPWQREDGMFFQVVDRPEESGNYPETSGSALIAYGILKAVRMGCLPVSYRSMGRRAFEGTVKRYLRRTQDGSLVLGGICLVAGLGGARCRDGSLSYYFSEPVVENEGKGVAPLLMCYTEMLRL